MGVKRVDECKILSTFFFKKLNMQILSTTGGTINFIPRENIDDSKTYSIFIYSEDKNKNVLSASVATIGTASFYNTYAADITLDEGSSYRVEVKNATDDVLIFRDKIFCTDQTANAYQMTSGVYTQAPEVPAANEFIYYEG